MHTIVCTAIGLQEEKVGKLLVITAKTKGQTIAQIIGYELRITETIAEKFRSWRQESNCSYSDIAAACGTPEPLLIAWELGTVSPIASMFCEVVGFLGEDYLFQASMLLTDLKLKADALRAKLEAEQSIRVKPQNFDALGAVQLFAA